MSINYPLQQPVNVAPGAISTLTIKAGSQQTLIGVKLQLNGTTFDKTKIDKIKVKIGPRLIWDLTMDQLNKINNYKGNADNARYVYLDFTERDQAIFPVKEIGGIDLIAAMPIGDVIVEVTINAAAVAPAMVATGYFEPSQANPYVLKYLNYPSSSAVAGKVTLPLNFRGALLKRTWHFYTGTNFTATTDGNINRIEVKKNGAVVFDQTCRDARFDQVQLKKTPQAQSFIVDYILDNNHDAQQTTISKTAAGASTFDTFEVNTYLTAPDSIQSVVEAIDVINNL